MSHFWQLEVFRTATAVQLADGSQFSYLELAERADRLASSWKRPGSLIFLQCRNDLASLTAYLAALRHGHTLLLLPSSFNPSNLRRLFDAYRPEHALTTPLVETNTKSVEQPDPRAALLLSTSGSTGSPKQVCLSRDNLQANAEAIVQYLEIDADERPITSLPMHYSYGLSVINSHLLCGATLLLTDEPLISRSFWNFFRTAKATSLAGVPSSYEVLERLRIQDMDLPGLRTLTQAGGRLPADKVRHFAQIAQDRGWRFFVMYGQTEATARMAYLSPELALSHPDTIGCAIPGGSFRLIDTEGHVINEPDVVGELVYRGPNVMLGYVKNRQDLTQLDPPIELHTGDLASRSSSGLYRIEGRLNRFIKLHGHRLSLDDLETQLMDAGIEALCAGRDDQLVIAHRPNVAQATLATLLQERMLLLPRDYRFVALDTWPLTPSGKIAYDQISALA